MPDKHELSNAKGATLTNKDDKNRLGAPGKRPRTRQRYRAKRGADTTPSEQALKQNIHSDRNHDGATKPGNQQRDWTDVVFRPDVFDSPQGAEQAQDGREQVEAPEAEAASTLANVATLEEESGDQESGDQESGDQESGDQESGDKALDDDAPPEKACGDEAPPGEAPADEAPEQQRSDVTELAATDVQGGESVQLAPSPTGDTSGAGSGAVAADGVATQTGGGTVAPGSDPAGASAQSPTTGGGAISMATDTSVQQFDGTVIRALPVRLAASPEENLSSGRSAVSNAASARARRACGEAMAGDLVATTADHLDRFDAESRAAEPRLQATLQAANEQIDAAAQANLAEIQAAAAEARNAVEASSMTTLQAIAGDEQTALASIDASTEATRAGLETAHATAGEQLDRLEQERMGAVDALYGKWDGKLRETGQKAGQGARRAAESKREGWLKDADAAPDGSFLDGPVERRRFEARADAATQVGNEYDKSLRESAVEQAQAAAGNKQEVRATIRDQVSQTRSALDEHKTTAESGLEQSHQAAQQSAVQAAQTMRASVQSDRDSAVTQLDQQEAADSRRVDEFSADQKIALASQAAQAVTACMTGAAEAGAGLQGAVMEFVAELAEMTAVDEATMSQAMAEMAPHLGAMAQLVLGQIETSIAASEEGIATGGSETAKRIGTVGESGVAQIQAVTDAVAERFAQLGSNATETLGQLASGHSQQNSELGAQIDGSFTTIIEQVVQALSQLDSNIDGNLSGARDQLQGKLQEPVSGKLPADINKYAQEAADQVQPRWKSVLRWVLIIAVVIATVAITILTGGAGGVLGAMALGAVLGGVSGAGIQIIDNVFTGKKWSQGVVQAAAIGAIGGMLGGGAGALAGKVTNVGLKFAIEVGGDLVGEVVGSLLAGQPLTWQGIATGLAIGAGVTLAPGAFNKLRSRLRGKVDVDVPGPTRGAGPTAGGGDLDVPGPTRRPGSAADDIDASPQTQARQAADEAMADVGGPPRRGGDDAASGNKNHDADGQRTKDTDSDADGTSGDRDGAADDAADQAARKARELPAAMAAARLIEETHDAANAPVPLLLTALRGLKRRFTWIKGFEAEPKSRPGQYSIWMIASKHNLGVYDHLDEHDLENMSEAERAKVFKEEADQGIYRGVDLRTQDKSKHFEYDRVDVSKGVIVEDKVAQGFHKNPNPTRAIETWANKQVFSKTKKKIDFLETQADHAIANPDILSASPHLPDTQAVKSIKKMEFRLKADETSLSQDHLQALQAKTESALQKLREEYPDWTFNVVYGGS